MWSVFSFGLKGTFDFKKIEKGVRVMIKFWLRARFGKYFVSFRVEITRGIAIWFLFVGG